MPLIPIDLATTDLLAKYAAESRYPRPVFTVAPATYQGQEVLQVFCIPLTSPTYRVPEVTVGVGFEGWRVIQNIKGQVVADSGPIP